MIILLNKLKMNDNLYIGFWKFLFVIYYFKGFNKFKFFICILMYVFFFNGICVKNNDFK